MITLPQRVAVGSAHGKLILTGEHAVVYDKPAIALPFPLINVKSTVEVSQDMIMIESDYYSGPLNNAPEKMQGLSACIKETLKRINKPFKGLLIRLSSTIPLGRGLGSSAAVAIAIVRSLFAFYKRKVSQKELMSLVHIAESYAHGNPSGIDMAAASSDYPVWFQKGKKPTAIQIGAPLYMVVIDTGRIGDTFKAVNSVKEKYLLEPNKTRRSMDRIGRITHMVKAALSDGDMYLVGRLLNLNHEELISLGVSDDGINQLVNEARKAGALGAKLTGGGLGGCMIALAQNLDHAQVIANVLKQMGAYKSWYFMIDKS